jgi:4-diphosphocytidyl-2-C-methyl-D-erythritol kinase
MIVYPNAKINIGLNIIEKRNDGFHNLESCFFPISLSDILEILPSEGKTTFQSSGIPIPGNPEENLCVNAWNLLNNDFNISGVKMHLHKQIPIGAGLGGGSADGAFALKALNELFDLNLSVDQLIKYAAKMGSDCAFFIKNTPAIATGRGEILSTLNIDLSNFHLVLINPGIHIGTAEAYSGITPEFPEKSVKELIHLPITDWQKCILNDFESEIFKNHPEIKIIKERLLESGAVYAAMSGSGSSVFGLFEKAPSFDVSKVFEGMFCWHGKF